MTIVTRLWLAVVLVFVGERALRAQVVVLDNLPEHVVSTMEARDAWLASVGSDGPGISFLVEDVLRWSPGQTVRVAFLTGAVDLHRDIEAAVRQIEESCNIDLDFGWDASTNSYRKWSESDSEYAAEIRVSFDQRGYFSLVGTDSINPSIGAPSTAVGGRANQRSLNLGGFQFMRPQNWMGVVRHEFMHALAFHHEHQNLLGNCESEFRWDDDDDYERTLDARGMCIPDDEGRRPGIYTYLAAFPNYWGRAKVDRNLRPVSGTGIRAGEFDSESVMLYRFPPLFYKSDPSPCAPTGNGIDLSAGDRAGLLSLYPREEVAVAGRLGAQRDMIALLFGAPGITEGTRMVLTKASANMADKDLRIGEFDTVQGLQSVQGVAESGEARLADYMLSGEDVATDLGLPRVESLLSDERDYVANMLEGDSTAGWEAELAAVLQPNHELLIPEALGVSKAYPGPRTPNLGGLHSKAQALFRQADKAYHAASGGKHLVIESGLRDVYKQAELYICWRLEQPNCNPANIPGASVHNYGFAIDVRNARNAQVIKSLQENGWTRTVMPKEPWHWESTTLPEHAAARKKQQAMKAKGSIARAWQSSWESARLKNDTRNANIEDFNQRVKVWQPLWKRLELDVKAHQAAIANYNQRAAAWNKKRDRLNDRVRRFNEEVASLRQLRARIERLPAGDERNRLVREYNSRARSAQGEQAAIEQARGRLSNERSALEKDMARLASNDRTLRTRLASLTAERDALVTLKGVIDKLKKEIESLMGKAKTQLAKVAKQVHP
ncbi:MAG: hypothetical protein AAF581_15675 [Planctomycetota bacterium]